jgi:transposase
MSLIETRREQMFPKLTSAEIDRLRGSGEVRRFAGSSQLMSAGRPSPGMIVLISGAATVARRDKPGHTSSIVDMGAGDFIAEVGDLSGRPSLVDVHAASDVEALKRLMTIPGVGPVTASAITATIQDASAFASGREFAAFLGLTPRQNSTGGKTRLGRITKMGDRYLRKLLVVGACATLRHRRGHSDALRLWASGMLERKTVKYKFNLIAVALANKVARIVFVLVTRGGQYDGRPVAA